MKKLWFTVFASSILALPLCAQRTTTAHVTLQAEIPFEFVVQNTTLPPGKYVIKLGAEPMVEVAGNDRKYYFLSTVDNPYANSHQSKLVFHSYRGQYFLSQIASTSTNRDLPAARVERELQKKAAAGLLEAQTEIVLAMR